MPRVEIYTKSWCGYCRFAKRLLDARGIAYREFDVTENPEFEREMRERSGRETVPQIFIDGRHIGGSDALVIADNAGILDDLPRVRDADDTP